MAGAAVAAVATRAAHIDEGKCLPPPPCQPKLGFGWAGWRWPRVSVGGPLSPRLLAPLADSAAARGVSYTSADASASEGPGIDRIQVNLIACSAATLHVPSEAVVILHCSAYHDGKLR